MNRALTALALSGLMAAMLACAKRTVEGRWHLESSDMPQGFNLPGESYMEITMEPDGVRMRDFVSSPETGSRTMADRKYPFNGEKESESDGTGALYTSARKDDDKLCTTERITHTDGKPELKLTVCYEVSWNGMRLTGTDDEGKKVSYERQ